MATRNLLSNHLARRELSLDFSMLGQWLPNPDPILKSQGKDVTTYRDMRHDALIGSCIVRRKASVQALEWGLDKGAASSRANKTVQAMLDALPMSTIIEQMQECTLYGYQPMEVIWHNPGGLWLPREVLAKPPEWYCFDADNLLRFKSRSAPLLGEVIPTKKYLLPRNSPTYQNPYGFADLSMCYWPQLFKKGGLKFWLAFTEKFGSAFSVGKLPRNATDAERATLLDSLEALIQNGVTTIPDDGSIELVEMAGKSASADLYAQLVAHCSSEIAIALLGQNQTTQASANKASATAGLEVTKDLRDGDARVIAAAINELIGWVCELNFASVTPPVFSFWDQKEQDVLQAARDKSNYDAGARFTNQYWMRGYGYQEGDLQPEPSAAAAFSAGASAVGSDPNLAKTNLGSDPSASTSPAFAEAPARDPLQAQTDALMQATAPQWSAMVNQLQALVDGAADVAALQLALVQAFGDLDSAELVKLMAAAMALAELKGIDSARQETGPQAKPVTFAEPIPTAPMQMAFSPEINIHLRTDDIQASLDAAVQTMAQAHAEKIKLIADAMPINITLPEQPAPTVNITVEQPAVSVLNTVQPAPVTVNNAFPSSATQAVVRDANDEIVKTITTYGK